MNMVTDSFKIIHSEYGKGGVKILHVSKRGAVHSIRELEVESLLTLNNHKDYETGDNSSIIATDTQKNTIYILAKQHGIDSPEEFGILLVTHFISKYPWVIKARANISTRPWQRITDTRGRAHNHAFVSNPMSVRVAEVQYSRGGKPIVSSGIRDLRVLKTTQSAFTNFVNDEYRSLPDAEDRLFSTIVTGDWTYGRLDKYLDYDQVYDTVQAAILDNFAGPADNGVFSASVQNSQNLTQRSILEKVPQIDTITISMPNVHYFGFDFSKFPRIPGLTSSKAGEVYSPVDKPSGQIISTLARADLKAKL